LSLNIPIMSFKSSFIAVLTISVLTVVLGQRNDGDCVAPAGSIENCSQSIYSNCKNATFIANRLAYSDQCSPISLFWDAPMYNMTILFRSNLTKSYSICIEPVRCTQACRTLDDGSEVPIEWHTFSTEPVCFKTERSDRPTMKFRFDAGNQWRCYGTFINFSYQL
jgi:hypothetical protein